MEIKVFVDGQEGTTGLKINERLKTRTDINVIQIDPDKRKDPDLRKKFLNEADIVFLCLPDAAARESVSMIENGFTRVIDASTAHRTCEGWAYGLPELGSEFRDKIRTADKVAVPGCHATGFNLLVHPLVKEGILSADSPVTCHSITGYSGGGKKLIERYETAASSGTPLNSPCFYALGLSHKHLPEMQKISGLTYPPVFTPIVGNFYEGMAVAVPLHAGTLAKKLPAAGIHAFFNSYYKNQRFVSVIPFNSDACLDAGFLGATGCNGTNKADIFVFGNNEQTLLVARFDNLGKGASGAAVQNMNIMLGLDESTGL